MKHCYCRLAGLSELRDNQKRLDWKNRNRTGPEPYRQHTRKNMPDIHRSTRRLSDHRRFNCWVATIRHAVPIQVVGKAMLIDSVQHSVLLPSQSK